MDDITRREAMKTALKGAAYAVPVVLAATVPEMVSAAVTPAPTTPVPLTTTPNTFSRTSTAPVVLTAQGLDPNAVYRVRIFDPSGFLANDIGTTTTTVSGNLSFSFVPSGVFDPAFQPSGQYTIRAFIDATNPFINRVDSPVIGKNAIGTFTLT